MAADVCRLMGEDEDEAAMKWIVTGWLLFIVSALFFIAAAWRAGDLLALAGGIFFSGRMLFVSRPCSGP
ncbi:hypothetical protein [Mesorhizobium captivum]|uniref:hypothetical protein n=1 Tax=Mesorhizobium captivum TaxID=3072319 RepID=UPI002A23F596|nr:hypothetical protein [Mesorhizobium sp. VK23E]MDX8511480.1 hypothetical protein [Mesorhizobium sp. VK23E]